MLSLILAIAIIKCHLAYEGVGGGEGAHWSRLAQKTSGE